MKYKKAAWIFLAYEILCYAGFLALDIVGGYGHISGIVKFCAIAVCPLFVVSLTFRKNGGYTKNLLSEGSGGDLVILCVIMAFTVFSDIFLLFTDNVAAGVVSFCAVQSLYFVWLCYIMRRLPKAGAVHEPVREHRKVAADIILGLVLRIIAAAGLGMLVKIKADVPDGSSELFFIIFYAVSFIANIVLLARIMLTRRWKSCAVSLVMLLVGLLLFVLCDINVAIYNIFRALPQGTLPEIYYTLSGVAMWLFYLPSQVLIIFSNKYYMIRMF